MKNEMKNGISKFGGYYFDFTEIDETYEYFLVTEPLWIASPNLVDGAIKFEAIDIVDKEEGLGTIQTNGHCCYYDSSNAGSITVWQTITDRVLLHKVSAAGRTALVFDKTTYHKAKSIIKYFFSDSPMALKMYSQLGFGS